MTTAYNAKLCWSLALRTLMTTAYDAKLHDCCAGHWRYITAYRTLTTTAYNAKLCWSLALRTLMTTAYNAKAACAGPQTGATAHLYCDQVSPQQSH